jgi:uncharacterized protein (DUF1684 family)
MKSRLLFLCALASTLAPLQALSGAAPAASLPSPAAMSYEDEIIAWRKTRETRLQAPESWLSLVGLDWLKEGDNTLGSAPGSTVRQAKLPAQLGVLNREGHAVTLRLAANSSATLNGKAAAPVTQLVDDHAGRPDVLRFGSLSMVLVRRGDRMGIRTRDTESAARTGFTGIKAFPTDATWRIEARWVPFDPVRSISITNVLGQVSEGRAPGKAVFERDGKTYELIPTQDEPDQELFFVLRDLTSGKETYGASRFLTAPAPKDGKVVLDFNKAYNPPCAFTPHATCPLPIPENRLKLEIRAGELLYTGPGSHED